jgi:FkbM family methyltransferase
MSHRASIASGLGRSLLRRRAQVQRLLLRGARRLVARGVVKLELKLEAVGSAYGGWIVPIELIRPEWLCYCGGVGEDITFDLGIIERFGVTVHAFDPTPRAIDHVAREAASETRFHFHSVGLWSDDTTLRFFAPKDPTHVSHSVVNLQRTTDYFEAPCRSVPSIMAELGHASIDLLKLDIEGAEHRVLKSTLGAGIRPKVICTEIDQPVGAFRFWSTIRRVRSAGYALVAMSGWNFTFVRKDMLPVATRRS